MAPLYKTGVFGETGFVVAALLVGVAFGFFLERGGLANARKLTGQFYLKDFTVLQAMFTAIVVAMLGVFSLTLLDALDLDLVYLKPTYAWPMAIGGALVGLGFAIGGYCPGTCVVAAVTGKIDALGFIVGILLGISVFAELFDVLAAFTHSGALAQPATIDGWLGVGPGVVVLMVVLMAIGVFWGIGKLQNRTRKDEAR